MTADIKDDSPSLPTPGSFDNPVISPDLLVFKPERFVVGKISFDGNREDSYVISLIDRDMVPVPGSSSFSAQFTVKATVEVTETFFKELVRVAGEQKSLKEQLMARTE
ncbi:hypothetical protein [Diaphorobacter nitroreducens]